jgi:hypothetical protein
VVLYDARRERESSIPLAPMLSEPIAAPTQRWPAKLDRERA